MTIPDSSRPTTSCRKERFSSLRGGTRFTASARCRDSCYLCLLLFLLACFYPSSQAWSIARGSRPDGITIVLPFHLRPRWTTVSPPATTSSSTVTVTTTTASASGSNASTASSAITAGATTSDSDGPEEGGGDEDDRRKAWLQKVLRSTVSATLLRGDKWRRRPVSGYAGDAFRSFLRGVAGTARRQTVKPIVYHNGPIMYSPIQVYMIYYGTWSNASGISTVTSFFNSLVASNASAAASGPPTVAQWWAINRKYNDGSKHNVSQQVSLNSSTIDAYSQGKGPLSFSQLKAIISSRIKSKSLPEDPNGIYVIFTSSDVTTTDGFCTQYCGYHTYMASPISSATLVWSFIGHAGRCLSACAAQTVSSPNGNPGIDASISILAHELAEAATDPKLNAWYDSSGYENADKCAWTFGTTSTARDSKGYTYYYNLQGANGTRFLVQQNWDVTGNACTLA
jgi:hypothetical protein